MRSLASTVAAICLLLSACSNSPISTSTDSPETTTGNPPETTSGKETSKGDLPENSAPATDLDPKVKELYVQHLTEILPTEISDKTLECMTDTVFGAADPKQVGEITPDNFQTYLKDNGDLVESLFEDGTSDAAHSAMFRCLTEEEFKDFLTTPGTDPEKVDCLLDELGGKEKAVELIIESNGEPPVEVVEAREACGITKSN